MNAQGSHSAATESQVTPAASASEDNVTSHGNSLGQTIGLFVVIFGIFCAGLYVLSLFTLWTMVIGTLICIFALFLAFDVVPRFLT